MPSHIRMMIFHETLINWYLQNKRELPWRRTKDPYLVWLSEIILQQTRVDQGMSYYLKFSEAFPKVNDLANANESTILKMWQGLGYYSRARNLHYTAKYVTNELNGKFPNNHNDLLKLKGVGDYTASAIASFCFDQACAVVDGNVYRVLARYFGIHIPVNSTSGIRNFKKLAESLIDKDRSGTYNQAIMDFGALQCKPSNPDCYQCPLNSSCIALEKKWVKILPVKTKKLKVRNRFFNYIVFVSVDGKTILEQRIGKGIWQGLYQFPLIETKEKVTLNQLLEIEEFQMIVPKDSSITLFNQEDIIHKLSHQHLNTQFWIVKSRSLERINIHWIDIQKFAVPVLISNFLAQFNAKSH